MLSRAPNFDVDRYVKNWHLAFPMVKKFSIRTDPEKHLTIQIDRTQEEFYLSFASALFSERISELEISPASSTIRWIVFAKLVCSREFLNKDFCHIRIEMILAILFAFHCHGRGNKMYIAFLILECFIETQS